MGIIVDIDEKILSELKLMVHVGATPVECVRALEGKMSRSSVYKYHKKFKDEMNAANISSEVVKEPVSKNEQLINELSGKNEELQKELHAQKCVIDSLQKDIIEKDNKISQMYKEFVECEKRQDKLVEEFRVAEAEVKGYFKEVKSDEIKLFEDITKEMIELYKIKNKDYGKAFSKSYEKFGAVMPAIRLGDKLNRFETLITQNSEVKTESIVDTLIDLANYAVMTIMEIKKENNWRDNEN